MTNLKARPKSWLFRARITRLFTLDGFKFFLCTALPGLICTAVWRTLCQVGAYVGEGSDAFGCTCGAIDYDSCGFGPSCVRFVGLARCCENASPNCNERALRQVTCHAGIPWSCKTRQIFFPRKLVHAGTHDRSSGIGDQRARVGHVSWRRSCFAFPRVSRPARGLWQLTEAAMQQPYLKKLTITVQQTTACFLQRCQGRAEVRAVQARRRRSQRSWGPRRRRKLWMYS